MASKHLSEEALLNELDYVLQRHTQASRGGRAHADFRFGNAEEGLESYALPQGKLPGLHEKLLAVNTDIHPYGYRLFHGSYGHGKRKNQVEILESGKISVKNNNNGFKSLEIYGTPARRFKLVKINKGNKDHWILIGVSPSGSIVEKEVKAASEKDYNFIQGRFIDCRTDKTIANLLIIQAVSAKALKKGLGGRKSLPFGLGMLFLNCRSFWMKDVSFGLDLVFLDKDFVVTEIVPMRGSLGWFDLPIYRAMKRQSVHALEVPKGYCAVKGIHVGSLLRVKK